METGQAEPRRGRRRCDDARCRRATGCRGISRRPRRAIASRYVSARGGAASIYSEGRREATAIGDSDGPGPSGADGGDARAGADFRGGLSSVLVRLSAQAERHAGAGNIASAGCARRQSRPRRGHPRLLREHRPPQTDGGGRTAYFGPAGAQADTAVASGRGAGRWLRPRHHGGDAARRCDFAAVVQYLPARARHRVDAPIRTSGRAGAIRGRLRGHVRYDRGMRAGRAADTRDIRPARTGATPDEDETGRPLARTRGLRLSRLSPAQADERSHLDTATPAGVLPPALALSTRDATDSTACEGADTP